MKIVIIGGSGLIGSKLAMRLREGGNEVVQASPASGVDTLTGKGLAEALKGAQVVVDVSNSPSFEDTAVLKFFETSTRNLIREEKVADVGHHVIVSIVGAERLPNSGYMRAKLAQEKIVKESKIPYTILRSTQFFEFIAGIAEAGANGQEIRLTNALMQPVAADDVASTLATLAVGKPLNGMVELGGPEAIPMVELGRRVLAAKGDSRKIISDASAPYFGERIDDRSLVPGANARLGRIGLEDWLKPKAA